MKIQSLIDKVALITGASRGIGKEILLSLAKNKSKVIGTAVSENGVLQIKKTLAEHKIDGLALRLDVKQPEDVANVTSIIREGFGDIQVLVNNAGITNDNLAVRMSNSDWEEVITTNLNSVFYLSKAVLRGMMKKRYGSIVNISSTVAFTGNLGQVNYSAAKAGVVSFTKSLALEVAMRNIRVNAVAPGFITTDMTSQLADKQKEEILKRIPLNKFGEPADIAQAVLFLLSDSAKYITGQTIHVNGGMYM